ncbi:hypothetical protein H7F36_02865 [Variovorax sp. PAMC28562]|nr:hypothetical protein [Variovorax sp. PAMC28562]QNK74206.1 hypothetical protein H7F36_02865 [Variovorax sp. PAMC28562]
MFPFNPTNAPMVGGGLLDPKVIAAKQAIAKVPKAKGTKHKKSPEQMRGR